MNHKKNIFLIFLITLSVILFACDTTDPKDDENNTLRVKFTNDKSSVVTITSIFIQPMGVVEESTTPQGDWSENIITDGKNIAPGESLFFTLPIPNTHWAQYRLGVDNGLGEEILLHEQPNYNANYPSITHWGSDERTVSVVIKKDASTDNYIISGWSDWAGIEN